MAHRASATGADRLSKWISGITGSFKDDADCEEIVRLGKEMRDAEPLEAE